MAMVCLILHSHPVGGRLNWSASPQVAISAQNGQILLFDLREQQRAATILPSTMAQATTVARFGNG
jgi:hypothetical protein